MNLSGGAIFRIVVAAALLSGSTPSILVLASASQPLPAQLPAGTWIGTAQVNSFAIPFRLEIRNAGDEVQGVLVNGKDRYPSSTGSYSDGHLLLHFDYYANFLDATIHDGVLTGTFGGHSRDVPIKARLNGKLPAADANPPYIAGIWEVAVDNAAKGEHFWKLRVRQTGPSVDAVIERIDGDTGNLYGVWRGGEFVVSHFTAGGVSYAVLRPQADGALELGTPAHKGAVETFMAHRRSPARTVALDSADDPLRHTYLKDANEPLAFRFPDLNGRVVSSRDPEFAHKVLIVSIGGSWCPNCQDEAPFLEQLYSKYHSRGLDIVELSFEESSQLQSLTRLKAVIRRYHITYPVLVAGTPDQLNERFPQVANLNCWPTTFFVGRDGLVKAVHTGYAGPATGADNHELETEITAQVERMLAAKQIHGHAMRAQVARKE